MDEVHIGVIGAGGRGGLASIAHRNIEGCRIVAACDIKPEVRAVICDWYGPETFVCGDYRDLVARDDVDVVFVTTPDNFHEAHAIAALEAGKHVYLEKPMTITIEGCDRVLQTARRTGMKLYCGHNMRHFASIQKMKHLIDTGAIGQVKTAWCRHFVSYGGDAYFKDWHADRRNTTGLLLQKGAHDIDVLHWLCGGYTRRVTAMGDLMVYGQIADRHDPDEYGCPAFVNAHWPPLTQTQLNPVVDVEDMSMMLMQLDNGVLASYQQCHFTPDAWRNYTIIGTEGRIENFNDSGDCSIHLWNTRKDGYRAAGDRVFELSGSMGGHGGSDNNIVAEFVRYVREGGKIHTSPIAARNAVAAGVTATQSLRDGSTPIDVPPVDPELVDYFAADTWSADTWSADTGSAETL